MAVALPIPDPGPVMMHTDMGLFPSSEYFVIDDLAGEHVDPGGELDIVVTPLADMDDRFGEIMEHQARIFRERYPVSERLAVRLLQNRGFEFLGQLDIEQFGAGEHPLDMVLAPKHGERNVEAESGIAVRAAYDFFEVCDLDEGTGGFVDDDIGAGYERKTGKDGFLPRPSRMIPCSDWALACVAVLPSLTA